MCTGDMIPNAKWCATAPRASGERLPVERGDLAVARVCTGRPMRAPEGVAVTAGARLPVR